MVAGLSMHVSFRPTVPGDGPAIGAFLAEIFHNNPAVPRYEERQFHWKYWRERADFPGPRSFVLTRDDQILAHAGVVPGRIEWSGGQLRALHLIDWVARPRAIGTGTDLLKHIGRTTDVLLSIGGSADTRKIMPALGFQPFGEATKFMQSVRPLKRLSQGGKPSLRRVLRVALDGLQMAGASRAPPRGWQVRVVGDAEIDALVVPPTDTGRLSAGMQRSAAMFRYMLACPATPMRLHQVIKDDGTIRGYFLLAVAGSQARLADCRINSDDPQDWQALVRLAVETAKQDPQISEMVAVSNLPGLNAGLLASGFRGGLRQPVLLLPMPGVTVPVGPVCVQMLDNDAAWIQGS